MSPASARGRRATWLLLVGGLVGAGLAGRELAGARALVAPDAAAIVDGVPIPRVELEQALAAAQDDRGTRLAAADQQHVLDRMIDEELLFARALALDLPRRDRRLRAEIVSTFIADVIAPAEAQEPTEAELSDYFDQHAARFAAEPLVRLEALFFAAAPNTDGHSALARAQAAMRKLRAGEPTARVAVDADRPPLPLPDSFCSRETLTATLGPTAARTALELAEGAISEPVRITEGYVVLQARERRASTPRLSDVRARVRADVVRERGERRLRETIDELRARADVRRPQ